MAVAQGPVLAAVLLLVCAGVHCSSLPPICPESCTCQRAPLLNCSSSGLSYVPQQIQDSVTELDLSHNLLNSVSLHRPHRNLRNVWLGNNTITHLSLCIERSLGSQSVSGRHLHRLRPSSRRRCVSWAPTLQLLSVERNQLVQLPEGLEGSASLWVLQLSFNRISTLQPGDLSHLRQLKELHLQHNLITSLHPQVFQDLAQLKVLDLSFNILTSLHPLMYLSLRNFEADVRLGGNRWQCDCSMRSLRRRMAYDSSRGLQTWSMVCAVPSSLSGKDLLQLEEDDLNCFGTENRPELHQDVTVYSGSEILLTCSTKDSMLWTPSGQASVSQPQADLLISDVTERDTGLYVCMSEQHAVVSVFNLQISRIGGARRKTRSLPRTSRQLIPQETLNRIGQERHHRATQCNLALAVCLSVFITFVIAFILGVLARPCIDILWTKVTKKKSPSVTNSVSSVEQRQYDNEAFSSGEEPEEIVTHRERRVTFSTIDYREDSNVQYYDTVASGDQESINNDAVVECEAANAEEEKHPAGDSGSENSLQQSGPEDNQRDGRHLSGTTDIGHTHKMEFEHIPDPVELEERRSLSPCSDSSLSHRALKEDKITQGDHTTPQLAEDSIQQRADLSTSKKIEVPQISIEDKSEIPEFSSEPFADWSPHTNNTNPTDFNLSQENEELFEFSDSARSTSARSSIVFGSFNDSKQTVVPTSEKQNRDMSSSSSYISEDEPTQYTVNSDQEKKENVERNHNKSEVTNTRLKHNASYEQQIHGVVPIRTSVGFNQCDYRHDTERPENPLSSSSSDSAGEPVQGEGKEKSKYDKLSSRDTREKVKPMPQTKWHGLSLGVTSFGKSLDTSAPLPPTAYSSSSSSESEQEITELKVKHNNGRLSQIKKHLEISAPLPPTDSSSSDDSADQVMDYTPKQEEMHTTRLQGPALDLEHTTHIKRHLDIKAPSPSSDSSSSSDSEDETTHRIKKQEQGDIHMASIPDKVSDSSSSSNEEAEASHLAERPGNVGIADLPLQKSQTVNHDPDGRWPVPDLEHIPSIKRRLDIKAPSPDSDSSSSSDSGDETTNRIKKLEQEKIHMARLPNTVSKTVSQDPGTQWPLLDLEHTTHIKRRLDIKAPSPDTDSSSSSDSEDETTHHTKKQRPGVVELAGLPYQESQTVSHDPETFWPALNLEHIPRSKRRLDIKAPSPSSDSSSSSDSEDETTNRIKKQEQGKLHMARLPNKVSQTVSHDPGTQWPLLDLEHTKRIKRRLDIKAPSPDSDLSSSSDSEDETTNHLKKEEQGVRHMTRLPNTVSKTVSQDPGTQWPLLDLEHTTCIKRRLDIKAPSPDSDSSTSSDSEDETTHHTDIKAPSPSPSSDSSSSSDSEVETTNRIKKQEQGKIHMARLPNKVSQTASQDPGTQWPLLDLEHTTRIKRRLDIKAPSPDSDSSSSSDSEDDTTNRLKKEEQGEVHKARLPNTVSQTLSHDPGTQWPLLHLEHTTHIKRHLDIKAPSRDTDSSSSSDDEDDPTHHKKRPRKVVQIKKHEQGEVHISKFPLQKSQTITHDPETLWPAVDLRNISHIKRRLDIKAPLSPPESSSSSDERNSGTTDLPVKVKRDRNDVGIRNQPGTKLYDLNKSIPSVKRRLNIKAPPQPADSCSSSSDNERHTVKRDRDKGNVGITNHDQPTMLHKLNLGIPYINRRLDIKAPSPQPNLVLRSVSVGSQQSGSNSSGSESEGENRDYNAKVGMGVSAISEASENEFIRTPKSPVINISHNQKTDHNIKLEKYAVISDDLGDKPTNDTISTTPEINPELQLRWATMNLGISRFRKRLEITSQNHVPPNLPTSPPPDFASSSSSESRTGSKSSQTRLKRRGDGMQELICTDSSLILENKPVNVSLTLKSQDNNSNLVEVEERLRRDYSSPTVEEKSNSETLLTDFGTPDVRALDIRAPLQRQSSSSSNSEDEMIDHSVPGLSVGVPHIKRRLNIKAPSPEPNKSPSSCSESENEVTGYTAQQSSHASNMSKMTDNDSQITYKRLIIKSSLPLKSQTVDHAETVTVAQDGISHIVSNRNVSLGPKIHSMSFKDKVKNRMGQSRSITDVDLPHGIKWTGVGRHLTDFSASSPRRHLDVGLSSSQQDPPAESELNPRDSFNFSSTKSGNKIKQDRGTADVTQVHKYSSLTANSVSLGSGRVLDKFDKSRGSTNVNLRAVSEDRRERKGLSALKAMSSERQKWDTEHGDLDKGALPLCDDHGPQSDTSRFDENIKPLAKQTLTQSQTSSTLVGRRGAADLLYSIPSYRSHNIGNIDLSQGAPPPIPATPPPDESVGLTWMSPQSITTKGWEGTTSYLQHSRNAD